MSEQQIPRPAGIPGEDEAQSEIPTLLRLALQAAGLGYAYTDDLRGPSMIIDRTVAEIAGLPPGTTALPPRRWLDIIHPDDRARVLALTKRLRPDGGAFTTTFRLVWPDGTTHQVVASGAATFNLDGRVPFASLMQDITGHTGETSAVPALETSIRERTAQLEAANISLVAARDRFRALFHGNPIPSVIYSPAEDRVIDANTAFLSFFRLPAERVIGHAGDDLDILLDGHSRRQIVAAMPPDGGLQNVEVVLPNVDGMTRIVLISLERLELSSGPCVLAGLVDITPLKQAEAQMRQLAWQMSLAEQTERLRIATTLHDDLQQRLYALQVRLASTVARAANGDYNGAMAEAERTRLLLNEALKITRDLSADISPPILQGESLYHALLWLTARLLEQHGLRVDVQRLTAWRPLPPSLRVALFQLIRDLLFNVVKFAGVDAAVVTLAQDDSHVTITVADAGAGFDQATTDPGDLGQMRRRTELFGGQMAVASRPGAGTTVTLSVPVNIEELSDHDQRLSD